MDDSANRVRTVGDLLIEEPRGPNAAENALYEKIRALVEAESAGGTGGDRLVAANAAYGILVGIAALMPRHMRHMFVKHVLTHYRGHVAQAAQHEHEGQQ